MEIIVGAAIRDDCWWSNRKRGRLDDEFEFDEARNCNNKRIKLHVESKLALRLSEFALEQVNRKKNAGACFRLNKEEFYERVSVVNTCTLVSAVDNSTTYDITFLAFLPADQTTHTFVTKVLVTRADETTNIEFLSIKGGLGDEANNFFVHYSESDDDDDDDDERLPESDDVEHSGEDLSQSNQKDSKENLSQEDLSQSNSKENLSESNQKDSKEDLCKFNDFQDDLYQPNQKDSQENLSKFDEEHTKTVSPYFLGGPKLFSQLNKYSREGSELIKEIDSFNDDVAKSDGFEVGYYPHMEAAGIHGTWIFKFYDRSNTTLCATDMNALVHLCQLALCIYNMKEYSNFDNIKVLKAMTSGGGGTNFNITFEASSLDKNAAKIFQARLVESFPCPYRNVEVVFVRTKGN